MLELICQSLAGSDRLLWYVMVGWKVGEEEEHADSIIEISKSIGE